MDGNNLILSFQNGLTTLSKVGPIVGAIFTAIFFRKNTRNAEFEKLKAGKFQEVTNQLLDSGYMTYTEFYKANNFLHIAEIADQVYKDKFKNKPAENQKYDFDWFMRFYDIVGNVSEEEMQILWAKILAGEVHQKGTYSLQLLDILKNFTQKQSELFNKVSTHCFISGSNAFIPNDEEYLKFVGITYQDILDLDGFGLMNSSADISLSGHIDLNQQFILNNGGLYMIVQYKKSANNNMKAFTFPQFPFTVAGRELVKLTGNHASDRDFLAFIQSLIRRKSYDSSFVITANKIVVEGTSIRFERIDLDSDRNTKED